MKRPSERAGQPGASTLQLYHRAVELLLFHTACYHCTGFSSIISGLKQFNFAYVLLHIFAIFMENLL